MSNKPILLFVVSSSCGACVNFKRKVLPDLEKELEKDSRLSYQIAEFEDMRFQKPINVNPHPELKHFVRFFPTLMVVPANLWNNHKSKLKAVVKHGEEENPNVDYSKNGILSWVNETLKNPLFSNVEKSETYIIPTYGQFRHSKIGDTNYKI